MSNYKKTEDHLGQEFNSIIEMCEYYNIPRRTFKARIEHGWSLEKALITPIGQKPTKKIKDYIGKEFDSIKALCEYYNISTTVYHYRLKHNWTLKDTLLTPAGDTPKDKIIRDHLGNRYNTFGEMCDHYNMPRETCRYRINQGWSLKKALTTPVKVLKPHITRNKIIKDHLGNEFRSITEICKYYKISPQTFKNRLKLNWSIERALTQPTKKIKKAEPVKDHLGNKFGSITAMCKYHNISRATFTHRIAAGWDLGDALQKNIVTDHLGNVYKSVEDMCKRYNIPSSLYHSRVHRGNLSLEQILTLDEQPFSSRIKCIDGFGHEFESINDLCKYYNITYRTYKKHNDKIFKTPEEFKKTLTQIYTNKQMTENLKILNCVKWPYFMTENNTNPNFNKQCLMHVDKILDIYHQSDKFLNKRGF